MSVPLSKYDIYIECGADFLWSFAVSDNEGNLVDLTGSTISAQLREYANSNDSLNFTVTHNGVGGKITLTMPHEDTNTIPYSMGVYDVFLTLNGTTEKIIYGDVTVYPNVTKPIDGEIIYLLSFASEDDFPMTGMTRRVYLSHQTNKMYRWNGSAYVTVNGKTFWDDIPDKPSTFPPSAHNHDDRYYTEGEVDTALSAKEDIDNLKALAYKDKADFYDDIDNLPSGYPPSPHNHDDRYYTEGEIDTALSGKSNTGHTHTMSDVTDLPTLGNLAEQDTVDWDTDIDDIPSEFPPEAHTHTMSEITDLPTLGTLAEQNTVDYETDIDNLPTLGALASQDTIDWDTDIDDIPSTFPPESHTHTMSDITDIPTFGDLAEEDDAPTDGEEYVRKNGDWAVASGGGGAWGTITGTLADQTDLQTALDAIKRLITGIESTTTATQNYSVNDLLIIGNSLYKVTANIANGGTITEGTNVTEITAATILSPLVSTIVQDNSFTPSDKVSWSWTDTKVLKCGRVRTLCFGATNISSSSGYVTIGNLANSSDYPLTNVRGMCILESGSTAKLFAVSTSGEVQIYKPGSNATYWGQTAWLV